MKSNRKIMETMEDHKINGLYFLSPEELEKLIDYIRIQTVQQLKSKRHPGGCKCESCEYLNNSPLRG